MLDAGSLRLPTRRSRGSRFLGLVIWGRPPGASSPAAVRRRHAPAGPSLVARSWSLDLQPGQMLETEPFARPGLSALRRRGGAAPSRPDAGSFTVASVARVGEHPVARGPLHHILIPWEAPTPRCHPEGGRRPTEGSGRGRSRVGSTPNRCHVHIQTVLGSRPGRSLQWLRLIGFSDSRHKSTNVNVAPPSPLRRGFPNGRRRTPAPRHRRPAQVRR